jgi:hypothetical protein
MAKLPKSGTSALGVRKHMLLFCFASETDSQRAGVTAELVAASFIMRDEAL